MWLCVKITAVTGFAPSVFSTSRHAAAAVSRAVSGSTTIQPGLALDDRHVRDVVAAHLVDAARHLEQAVQIVELRLAPQARVHASRGASPSRKPYAVVSQTRRARLAPDHELGLVRDPPALRVRRGRPGRRAAAARTPRSPRAWRRSRAWRPPRRAPRRRPRAAGVGCVHAIGGERGACGERESIVLHDGFRKFGLRLAFSAATPSFDSSVP